ncbi:uncharacterized protein [Ptychodera flava]|uniref:uncharacterized protein n=1 Tax=Ptychodera flava TaxID=63121 RepID=UPI003969D917
MLRKYPDQLSWSDVKTLDVSELGWLPRGHHDQTQNRHSASDAPLTDTSTLAAEWLFIDDNISYGSQRVIRELKVYEDWTWSLHILNRKVSQWNGIPTILSGDKYELLSLFMIAAKSKVCPGFEVCSRRETRSTQGDVIGRTETLLKNINNTEVSSLIHRSTGCQMLLSIQHAEITCKRCATLKKNCGKDLFEGETPTGVSKFKKESIMSEQELKDKLSEERKHRLNAQKREQRLRETVKKEMILFSNNAHEDFVTLFTSAQETGACGNNPDLLLLWDEQKKMLQTKGATGRRWHPKIIRMCLSIWMRSPRAYEELKRSGMLILPSGRLLSMYKNCVDQNPGLNDAVLEWMVREADNTCLPIEGRNGGIVLDEMAIQEDLQIKFTAEGAEVVGLVCLGDENDDMQTIISGEDTTVTATHVLQMVFLGNT